MNGDIITFLQVIASFAMAIIVLYYSNKTLKLSLRDRERPRIIELVRRFIVPLKYYLEEEIGTEGCIEFNQDNLLDWLYEEDANMHAYSEFNIQLEKLQKKDIWDEKLCKYNECCKKLCEQMNTLEQELKKLLNNDYASLINEFYNKKAKEEIASIDNFKSMLIDHFFTNYNNRKYGNSLNGAWYYIDDQIFDEIKEKLNHILEEIDSIRKTKDSLLEELINILEYMLNKFREDYNLTPSEQIPLTKFYLGYKFRI
jgi:hypothetical protein